MDEKRTFKTLWKVLDVLIKYFNVQLIIIFNYFLAMFDIEKCDTNKERSIHAISSLVLPLPKCRCLVCLFPPRQ